MRKNYTRLKMIHTDDNLKKPPKRTQQEKEARLYDLAKKIGVKIGGAK